MRKTLLALVLLAAGGIAQANVELNSNHPDQYTVVKGDTLWDISGKFLRQPWKWPEIWHANPQVKNPHLIYPGDVLSLVYIDGKPRLVLSRGDSHGTIRLSPGVRRTPMAEIIPTIPLEAINSFLLRNRIVDSEKELKAAPYVLAGEDGQILGRTPDQIYVRGDIEEEESYDIFRQGKAYIDPTTGKFIGINADFIATGKVVQRTEAEQDDDRRGSTGVGTVDLVRTTQEVHGGDRLFATEERQIRPFFMLSAPGEDVSRVILDVPRGVTQIGKYDVVTINLGCEDGIKEGHTLSIYKTGETVKDRETNQLLKLPDELAGKLVVFRPYERLSYALVMEANRPMRVMDKVKSPD